MVLGLPEILPPVNPPGARELSLEPWACALWPPPHRYIFIHKLILIYIYLLYSIFTYIYLLIFTYSFIFLTCNFYFFQISKVVGASSCQQGWFRGRVIVVGGCHPKNLLVNQNKKCFKPVNRNDSDDEMYLVLVMPPMASLRMCCGWKPAVVVPL